MDKFREECNQAARSVGMETPAAVYELSPRSFPAHVPEPEYPETMLVRSVKH